jgi:type I restriction enzyme M protein
MNVIVIDLFDRLLARVPTYGAGILRADEAARAEVSELLRAPLCTVIIKGQEAARDEPLAVLVATAPSLAADYAALLELAARKARAHNAPYFVTWTLRKACLWETPRPGTPAARDQVTKLRDYPEVFEIPSGSANLPEPARIAALEGSKAILKDLESLFRNQALDQVQLDATYFVRRLLYAVHRLLPLVTDSLHLDLNSNHEFREEMAVWAVKQGVAGGPRDLDFARSIARQIVYRLLGKVLFYHSLRRSARQLPDLDFRGADTSEVLPNLRRAFARALEIDYHAVFAEDLPDRVPWPANASRELAALIHDFHTRDFSHVPQDVIGTVFERLIPPEERHGLGQYFTPENLCDLVLAFCVCSPTDMVLDPTCGTGTFLIRAYDRLRALGRHDHTALLSQLWGVDIAPFPAELATINLFRQHIGEPGNFPRIVCDDFFSITPGQRFRFPPPKMDLAHPVLQEQSLPQFDAVVGNFPFIRQEKIETPVPGYKAKLEGGIAEGWLDSHPDAFTFRSKQIERRFQQLRTLNQATSEYKEHAHLRLSGKADMLAYLFFQAARFLRPSGRMGIITSNAWLDVDYGYKLQRFLLAHFKIVAILESRCEPWFTEADVNTIATIVERCTEPKEREANLVKFVKVKRRLGDLIHGSPEFEKGKRLHQLRNLTGRIELCGRRFRNVHPFGTLVEEDDNFRIRVRNLEELRLELEEAGRTAKWGLLIRGPEVLSLITKEWVGDNSVPLIALEDVIEVQNGIPTRIILYAAKSGTSSKV